MGPLPVDAEVLVKLQGIEGGCACSFHRWLSRNLERCQPLQRKCPSSFSCAACPTALVMSWRSLRPIGCGSRFTEVPPSRVFYHVNERRVGHVGPRNVGAVAWPLVLLTSRLKINRATHMSLAFELMRFEGASSMTRSTDEGSHQPYWIRDLLPLRHIKSAAACHDVLTNEFDDEDANWARRQKHQAEGFTSRRASTTQARPHHTNKLELCLPYAQVETQSEQRSKPS